MDKKQFQEKWGKKLKVLTEAEWVEINSSGSKVMEGDLQAIDIFLGDLEELDMLIDE